MVKRSMAMYKNKDDAMLRRALNNCQLAIKLLLNTTYGYTSASFSGRMPCSALADSIVAVGRATLNWATTMVEALDRYPCLKVVYGDTDSLFIRCPGRSREEAFEIGAFIAREVTSKLPHPMELKFDKVYHPCFLVSKKRYVGYAYESPLQTAPSFDAKGIETVRRDGCGILRKLAESSLRTLFDTSDLDSVRVVLEAGWQKVLCASVSDGASVKDFFFAREVKWGKYKDEKNWPPGFRVAWNQRICDPMAQPPYKWRVPFIVVVGPPTKGGHGKVKECVQPPSALLLRGSHLQINSNYYITKVLNPALSRLLQTSGCNVDAWYQDFRRHFSPRLSTRRVRYAEFARNEMKRKLGATGKKVQVQATMDSFATSGACGLCFKAAAVKDGPYCESCGGGDNTGIAALSIAESVKRLEAADAQGRERCRRCAGVCGALGENEHSSDLLKDKQLLGSEACRSLDCSILYQRLRSLVDLEDVLVARRNWENNSSKGKK
jgi:DNA polymerase zeta